MPLIGPYNNWAIADILETSGKMWMNMAKHSDIQILLILLVNNGTVVM